MSFKFVVEDYSGDFGLTFSLDGPYNGRLGSSLIALDTKNSELACYSDVSSSLRYGPRLANVNFGFMRGREYTADVIVDGELVTLYLDNTVCITARFSDMVRRNFAFYSNGAAVKIYGMEFYE